MGTLDQDILLGLGEEGESTQVSSAALESHLVALEDRYTALSADASILDKAKIELEMARVKIGLNENEEAATSARQLIDTFIQNSEWELAAEACDTIFLAGKDNALVALGQGIWLAVSYPINPELTLKMLQHVVDDTPDDADGAAVAAAVGVYIVDLRTEGEQHKNLIFFANQLLGAVARRHSDIDSPDKFNFWLEKLQLTDPDKILVRLRNVIDVLVQDDWWFDRDELRQQLPVN
ncbi:hypothetical protein MNBD_GAMMA12-3618 [hydrothermal vent metagenome]|uniref:Uncharacterized protein n=1 Tax=hydrothermal vent metagenome TaxID=652676 RepID=A0A3B0YQN9_9ZZZZ